MHKRVIEIRPSTSPEGFLHERFTTTPARNGLGKWKRLGEGRDYEILGEDLDRCVLTVRLSFPDGTFGSERDRLEQALGSALQLDEVPSSI